MQTQNMAVIPAVSVMIDPWYAMYKVKLMQQIK
jgi:hypothetical protein